MNTINLMAFPRILRLNATRHLWLLGMVSLFFIFSSSAVPSFSAPINLFPYNREAILAVPYITIPETGGNGEKTQGSVSLQTGFSNRYGHTIPTNDLRYAYTLNGETISPILNAGDNFEWDSTTSADGGHALGMVFAPGTGLFLGSIAMFLLLRRRRPPTH